MFEKHDVKKKKVLKLAVKFFKALIENFIAKEIKTESNHKSLMKFSKRNMNKFNRRY